MKNLLLVLIRDPAIHALLEDLGYKVTPPTAEGYRGLMCTQAVPEWGGAFLALTPAPNALPPDLDPERAEDVLVPLHSVVMAAHLHSKRAIGFQVAP